MEQEEYTKEEIDWSYIEFVDNQDVLDMIEKVSNISSMMNAQAEIYLLILFLPSLLKDMTSVSQPLLVALQYNLVIVIVVNLMLSILLLVSETTGDNCSPR